MGRAAGRGRAVARRHASRAVVQTIGLPTGHCPGDVVVVGGRLAYGHSCSGYLGSGPAGGIGVVDATTGASHGSSTTGPTSRPVLAPGPPGQVYAADAGTSPTSLALFEVTGAAPQLLGARAGVCSNLRDLSAAPDGDQVVTSCGHPYEHTAYSAAAKLAVVATYPTGPYPVAGAWSGDGTAFVAGTDSAFGADVHVYPPGAGTPVRTVDLGSTTEVLQARGLAVSRTGSRVWAVTGPAGGGPAALRVIDVPSRSASALTAVPAPRGLYAGGSTTVTGRLTTAGQGVAGAALDVTRVAYVGGGATSETRLPAVPTGPDGSYSFADTLPSAGHVGYLVQWAGDSTTQPAQAMDEVVVWSTETRLRLDVTRTADPATLRGTVLLSYDGPDPLGGHAVAVDRTVAGRTTRLSPELVTNANGWAEFTDSPPPGTVAYMATVQASGVHPAQTAQATSTVLVPTSTTVTAPASVLAGQAVTTTGTVSSGSAGLAGVPVAVTRSGCTTSATAGTTTTTSLGSTTTAADGTWRITDPGPPVGSCTYTASYAGGGGYAPSRASAGTAVSKRDPGVSLTVLRGTGSSKKYTYLTGHLSGWHTNRELVLTAQPAGGAEAVVARGLVNAAGELTGTVQPKTTTTYRARYAGDDWYLAVTAVRVQ